MKNISGAIATLTSLVQINNKRLMHYKRSADKAKEIELKLLFMRYAVQSQGFMNKLNRWIMENGGSPTAGEAESNLMITWNRIKESLSPDTANLLLSRCELLEQETLRIYQTVLALNILPSSILQDLQKQSTEFEIAMHTMKGLQETGFLGIPVATAA
jgi:uncharacterized protein (TIGR02284 family)